MDVSKLADPAAWSNPAAFERYRAAMYRRAAALRQTHTGRDVPSFGRWLNMASPGWPWHYRHLKVIRRYLKRVEVGEITRLMIFLHPRSFKSQMVTVRFPAYLLERDPLTRIIVGSYGQELAESFAMETRRIVTERGVCAPDELHRLFDYGTGGTTISSHGWSRIRVPGPRRRSSSS